MFIAKKPCCFDFYAARLASSLAPQIMPPAEAPRKNQIPLVVDLDGTLIKTDLLWEYLARLLQRNPFSIFQILFWWTRGRACLKKKLAARIKIDPVPLPYN